MIEIKNLSFNYRNGDKQIFDEFNMNFKRGGTYGLLGKNGTGKSTLLYLIMGLLRPQKGEILFDGVNTRRRLPSVQQEIFIVPEEFFLPNIKLKEYINTIIPFYPKFSYEELKRCLDIFEMEENVQLKSLSMGQKKKIYISIALAANTSLLLMDEPTNGLDIPSKGEFRRALIGGSNEERCTIISTHQIRDIEALLEKIVIINNTQCLLNCSIEEIARKLQFKEVENIAPGDSIIYSEPSINGHKVIMSNDESSETIIDLEMLFTAVHCEKEKIAEIFKKR